MIDRVSRVTIDETGVRLHEAKLKPMTDEEFASFKVHFGPVHVPCGGKWMEATTASQITAAANAVGFYGDDAVRFAREVDNATEFMIGRVAASGGDKRRFRDRRSRARLREECLRQAGVPKEYWPPEGLLSKLGRAVVIGIKVALTWSKYSVPLPWNIVIAAVALAVERYLAST